ncbi:MAG TPA: M28 family peptidase [Steroidobacteraceae bacterium]|jgi:Zn-dependent M28 family amino/carboxypeptidase|nr:M28 family peptidase [Steroidobacteraceae bacterium]
MRIWGYCGVLASSSLLLAACSVQPKLPPPSTDIDEAVFREHIRVLASDDFAGRQPGTPGEDKTVAYLVEQFRKLGLKPGNGESFLQAVPMTEILAGADASLSIAGEKRSSLMLAYGKDMIIWSKRGRPNAELRRSELVFVGYGIVAPEYAWNDYAAVDVRGKTVVALVNDPGFATKDPKVFRGGAMTYYGRWEYKVEEAARQGAAGVLLIHDGDAVGYEWDVIRNTWSGAQFALAGSAERPSIEGWIRNEAARSVFAAAGLDFAAVAGAAARAGFKAIPMGLQVDATLHTSVREFISNNVIALWPGGSRRHEYVVYTAHWDHLGRDLARAGHNIFNGASDNASGVAGLLALGQSFIRTKPVADRSIVLLALTGAESGLLGSQYYVEHPVFALRDTAAVLNLDMLHIGGPTRDLNIFGSGNTDLEQYARGVALLQGREVTPEPTPEYGLYFRSDNLSFANAGVPVLYAKGGIDDAARGPVWGRAQMDDYMAHRYHRESDQYSRDWDVRGAVDDLRLYYEVGIRLAHTKRFPRWYPNSEFRVSRGRQAAP